MKFTYPRSVFLVLACVGLISACDETTSSGIAETNVGTSSTSATSIQNPLDRSGNRKLLQAMDICIENYPDMLAVRTEMRRSNFATEGRFGDNEFFSAFNRNIVVLASTGTEKPTCGFGRNTVRDDEAVLLASALVAAKFGDTPLVADFSDEPRFLAGWLIETDAGEQFTLTVTRQLNISSIFRGSLFILQEYDESET